MEQGHARGGPSGQLASGLFGAALDDRNEREKVLHNVSMRGRGRAFGRNTTVVGPSYIQDRNGMLVIWRSDIAVAEEAKLRGTSAGRRVRPSPTSDRSEPPARVTAAFSWDLAGTNPTTITGRHYLYHLNDDSARVRDFVRPVLDTHTITHVSTRSAQQPHQVL